MMAHPTGKTEAISLTGMLMPWVSEGERPALLTLKGSDLVYIPLWEDVKDLRAMMSQTGQEYDSIKVINDGHDFLEGLASNSFPKLRIITNLRFVDDRVRYHEIDPSNPIYVLKTSSN